MSVSQRLRIDIPDDGGDPKEAVVSVLVGIGLLESDARRLVEDELVLEPQVDICLSELLCGKRVGKSWQMPTAEQSSAATKLLAYIQRGKNEPLTDDEKAVLNISTRHKVNIKDDGFSQRAAGYCKNEEVLHKLLEIVIAPTTSPRSHSDRLIQAAAEILAVALEEEQG